MSNHEMTRGGGRSYRGCQPETAAIPLIVLDGTVRTARPAAGCGSGAGCGRTAEATEPALSGPTLSDPALSDPVVAAKVADHPCYSADAHQYYARMHVAVAPGCNIQCHYCNRKFDCVNETRPGVTSSLLTPEQALAKVRRVAGRIKHLRVVGIAGPGEPLANAARTLRTLELVGRHCPDLRLCLSTNGLNLVDHVGRIADLGVDHVTVTVNMTDPEVGARIYPWVAYRGRRYTGRQAARVLSERQLAGLHALADRKILCKVNSVLIPGVNDEHMVEVSRTIKRLGAFVHNIMPLVSDPAHGTHYGLTGQRGPTNRQLRVVRERCEDTIGANMAVMRHCRRCRADAVGLLGEDRGAEFDAGTLDTPQLGDDRHDLAGRREARAAIERWRAEVAAARAADGIATDGTARPPTTALVAVATTGGGVVNQHFGRAAEFWVYEAAPRWARLVDVRQVPRSCGGPEHCDEPSARLAATLELLGDCAAVLCAKIGPRPHSALTAAGIEPVEIHDLVEPAVAQVGARLVAGTQTDSITGDVARAGGAAAEAAAIAVRSVLR